MKKSILAIVLAIATLVTFIVPASAADAWSWAEDGEFKVAQHKAALIKELNEDGTSKIVIDGEKDSCYDDGDSITSYEDDEIWTRLNAEDYPDIVEAANGNFEAYIAVDPRGLFIWAEIQDTTLFEEDPDNNHNEGDYFQI